MAIGHNQESTASGSLLSLLHPHGQAHLFAGALTTGLLMGWLCVTRLSLPRLDEPQTS
jgi:hypothetical protein